MSFVKCWHWQCTDCGKEQKRFNGPERCENPDCPSNRPSNKECFREWASDEDCAYDVQLKAQRYAHDLLNDAGKDGVIIALNEEEAKYFCTNDRWFIPLPLESIRAKIRQAKESK